ncbi:MAG TPA: hypothetical protein VFZ66_11760 [Herpetosiphonaceae bacterium]
MTASWFDELPVIGKLAPQQAAAKLREMGEHTTADTLESTQSEQPTRSTSFGGIKSLWPFQDKPWQHTTHAFGYLAPSAPGSTPQPIQHAGNIAPDPTLKNGRIKITLDRLRVASYPGGGIHRVLFDFYAQNQVADNVEHLHFNSTYRVREGEQAAIIGYPVFIGLNVGTEGVAFKCFTVNVQNDDDEAMLDALDSDVFKAGLKLVDTLQPAIAPLSSMAFSLTKSIAARNRNVAVQDFYMGLDFGSLPMGARLAQGAYLAVQIPEQLQTVWDWSEWVYNPNNGQVVNKNNPAQIIPYNYIVFSVGKYEGP